jgi:hypothetical protein
MAELPYGRAISHAQIPFFYFNSALNTRHTIAPTNTPMPRLGYLEILVPKKHFQCVCGALQSVGVILLVVIAAALIEVMIGIRVNGQIE